MSRELLKIYAVIIGFAILIYVLRGGGDLDVGRLAVAVLFIAAAGPIIKMYWGERDKARRRRQLEKQEAKEIEK